MTRPLRYNLPCQRDLGCYLTDGHTGDHAYAGKVPAPVPAPPSHALTSDCIGGGCDDCEQDIADLASVEALLAQAIAEVPDGYGPGEGSVRWASDIAGTPSGRRLLALAIGGAA